MKEGEIHIQPDGTKVQIYTREDGKKVRRIFKTRKVPAKDVKEGDIIVRSDGTRVRKQRVVVRKKKTPAAICSKATPQHNCGTEGGWVHVRENPVQAIQPRPNVESVPPSGAAPKEDAMCGTHETQDETKKIAVKLTLHGDDPNQQHESDVEYLNVLELTNLLLQLQKPTVLVDVSLKDADRLDKIVPKFDIKQVEAQTVPVIATEAPLITPEPEKDTPAEVTDALPGKPSVQEQLPAGLEAVPKDVAEAGRAVKELGITDIKSLVQGDTETLLKELKFANYRKGKLEQQLIKAGIAIADDIPYEEAREKIGSIGKRLMEIGGNDVEHPDKEEQARLRREYYELTLEMERLDAALVLTDEYREEQEQNEVRWEEKHARGNDEALKQIRRHMPLNCRSMTIEDLTSTPSPNGKILPKVIARKFKRTSVLQLLRFHPDEIEKMHPCYLSGLGVMGMTLTERRAVHAQLRKVAPKWHSGRSEPTTGLKWKWYELLRANLKLEIDEYERHCEQYGPPGSHSCHMIGAQCPLVADKKIDYSTADYGFPEEELYPESTVLKPVEDPGAQALKEAQALAREKVENERATALKKHYKNVLFVSRANGSCVAMDEAMDTIERKEFMWVENMIEKRFYSDDEKRKEIISFTGLLNELKRKVQDLAERSGIETRGARNSKQDGPDPRSTVECALCEELNECLATLFSFIEQRMKEIEVGDSRVSQTIDVIRVMMRDLHARNLETLKKLGVDRPDRSRKLKTIAQIEEVVRARAALATTDSELSDSSDDEVDMCPSRPPPKAVLGAINTRGGEGRGGLLAAIAGKPKMGGGLMAAIAAARG